MKDQIKNSQEQTKRLFLAIFPNKEILDPILKIKKDIDCKDLRWISKKNMHLTVYFIGVFLEKHIQELTDELSRSFFSIESFKLKFEEIVTAPPKSLRPRMVWAEFKKNNNYENLFSIARKIVQKFDLKNGEESVKNIIPHITLARSRKGFSKLILNKIKQPKVQDLFVDSCFLIESELSSSGSNYSIIKEFKFK